MYLLEGTSKHYKWGKQGLKNAVAKIAILQNQEINNPNDYFSEFWWGTHQQGMSQVISPDCEQSQSLGEFFENGDLSYLLKILSIRTCLSLQIHPDRVSAERLHRAELENFKKTGAKMNYPDPFDKPELVVALRDFGGFSGFASWEEILDNFSRYEALREGVGAFLASLEAESNRAVAKKRLFEYMVSREAANITEMITGIEKELIEKRVSEGLNKREDVTLKLIKKYGADVGVILTLMLNYIELRPLEGMLLAPNVPHCYFKGEVIEIMHSSNNVIRLGLTGKYKDKKNLLECIDYGHDELPILNKKEENFEISKEKILSYSTKFDEYFKLKIIGDFKGDKDILECVNKAQKGKKLMMKSEEKSMEMELLDYELETKNMILLNLGGDVEVRLIRNGKDTLKQKVSSFYFKIFYCWIFF